jgi:uncharacterized protein
VAFDEDLKRKAEAGNCAAQSVLGICYLDGIDTGVDYQEAFRLLSAAADQGAPRAVLNLARMYAEGLGVPKDVAEAVRLYKTVSAVEFLALIALGRIYSRGEGVPTDRVEAKKWYSAATTWARTVGDCPEIEEATTFVGDRAE